MLRRILAATLTSAALISYMQPANASWSKHQAAQCLAMLEIALVLVDEQQAREGYERCMLREA